MSSESSSVPESNWVKIPLRADEPAHCALFKHFLNENQFAYMESAENISVLKADTSEISAAIETWASSMYVVQQDIRGSHSILLQGDVVVGR